jgi:NADPH:quinone reductase-like Zn-dependent oxidoreductase
MKAQVLPKPAAVETNPLVLSDVSRPETPPGHVLVQVRTCGVCHTDLHLVEGELPNPALPVIPGHEIIGVVAEVGRVAAGRDYRRGCPRYQLISVNHEFAYTSPPGPLSIAWRGGERSTFKPLHRVERGLG